MFTVFKSIFRVSKREYLHLVPRVRMRGALPPLLHMSSWSWSLDNGYFMAQNLVKHRGKFTFTMKEKPTEHH
jgi:hypothetical protein